MKKKPRLLTEEEVAQKWPNIPLDTVWLYWEGGMNEKLKEITKSIPWGITEDNANWLVGRVRELEAALETLLREPNCSFKDDACGCTWDNIGPYNIYCEEHDPKVKARTILRGQAVEKP